MLSLGDELSVALGKPNVRITKRDARLFAEVPKAVALSNGVLDLLNTTHGLPAFCALLGLDTDGKPLVLRLTSPEVAHVLIAGTTGSGKTVLLRSMITSLAFWNRQRSLQLVLIDPKGRGFEPMAKLPHTLGGVIINPHQAAQRLKELVREMERRDAAKISEPRIIVAIDELVDLLDVAGDEVRTPITRLCQRGREAGIHVIAATQKPSASVIGGMMKANFPVRLIGRVASKDEARHATGLAKSGAELLSGRGDFLLIHNAQAERFKAAWLNAEMYDKILRRIVG